MGSSGRRHACTAASRQVRTSRGASGLPCIFHGEIGGEGGRFRYEGVVDQGRVRADIRWIKERWYRTIERDLEFVGTVQPARHAVPAAEASADARAIIDAGRQCEP
jgi:hypothetical protein